MLFKSDPANLSLDLRYVTEASLENVPEPEVKLELLDLSHRGHMGLAACCNLVLSEGQCVTFVLRTPPEQTIPDEAHPTPEKAQILGVPYESKSLNTTLFNSR